MYGIRYETFGAWYVCKWPCKTETESRIEAARIYGYGYVSRVEVYRIEER